MSVPPRSWNEEYELVVSRIADLGEPPFPPRDVLHFAALPEGTQSKLRDLIQPPGEEQILFLLENSPFANPSIDVRVAVDLSSCIVVTSERVVQVDHGEVMGAASYRRIMLMECFDLSGARGVPSSSNESSTASTPSPSSSSDQQGGKKLEERQIASVLKCFIVGGMEIVTMTAFCSKGAQFVSRIANYFTQKRLLDRLLWSMDEIQRQNLKLREQESCLAQNTKLTQSLLCTALFDPERHEYYRDTIKGVLAVVQNSLQDYNVNSVRLEKLELPTSKEETPILRIVHALDRDEQKGEDADMPSGDRLDGYSGTVSPPTRTTSSSKDGSASPERVSTHTVDGTSSRPRQGSKSSSHSRNVSVDTNHLEKEEKYVPPPEEDEYAFDMIWRPQSVFLELEVKGKKYGVKFHTNVRVSQLSVEGRMRLKAKPSTPHEPQVLELCFERPPKVSFHITTLVATGFGKLPFQDKIKRTISEQVEEALIGWINTSLLYPTYHTLLWTEDEWNPHAKLYALVGRWQTLSYFPFPFDKKELQPDLDIGVCVDTIHVLQDVQSCLMDTLLNAEDEEAKIRAVLHRFVKQYPDAPFPCAEDGTRLRSLRPLQATVDESRQRRLEALRAEREGRSESRVSSSLPPSAAPSPSSTSIGHARTGSHPISLTPSTSNQQLSGSSASDLRPPPPVGPAPTRKPGKSM